MVDSAGVRHHIPTYADDACFRWVKGLHVSETGLNAALAGSLPEGAAWSCDGYITATNEGASYLVTGHVRHWIQDSMSFWAYADSGYHVVRGISMAEVRPIPEGSYMPRQLDLRLIKGHVVRVADGTAYYVDPNGLWHWIPNGGVWGCITARHSVAISDATWAEVNALKHEGAWAACGM